MPTLPHRDLNTSSIIHTQCTYILTAHVSIYICTYIHTYRHTYVRTYIQTTYGYRQTDKQTDRPTDGQIYGHTHTHTWCTYTCMRAGIHTCIPTCMRTKLLGPPMDELLSMYKDSKQSSTTWWNISKHKVSHMCSEGVSWSPHVMHFCTTRWVNSTAC